MERFDYLATDNQNKQIKGVLEAENLLEAKTKLRQTGLCIIWVRKESNSTGGFYFSRIKNIDLAIFSHQFSVLIAGGVPLVRALKALAQEAANKRFRSIIDKISFDIENGASLSTALQKYPNVFSIFFVILIKSAEAAGILPDILSKLAKYLDKEEDLKRKISSSFAYPIVVGVTALGVVSFLLIFIVPVFSKVYKTLRVSLPAPTVALIVLSNIFIKFWWIILLLLGLSFYFLKTAGRYANFALAFDRFKLKIPVFGSLNRKVAVCRFIRTLSSMLGSGLTLGSSLTIVKDVVGNKAIANAIESIQRDITQGNSISHSLKTQKFFPPIVAQMISVGEESGNLNLMLEKCADFLDEEIDQMVKQLIVKIEPVLTFFLAVLVGFIALAIYLPMFDMMRHITR